MANLPNQLDNALTDIERMMSYCIFWCRNLSPVDQSGLIAQFDAVRERCDRLHDEVLHIYRTFPRQNWTIADMELVRDKITAKDNIQRDMGRLVSIANRHQ